MRLSSSSCLPNSKSAVSTPFSVVIACHLGRGALQGIAGCVSAISMMVSVGLAGTCSLVHVILFNNSHALHVLLLLLLLSVVSAVLLFLLEVVVVVVVVVLVVVVVVVVVVVSRLGHIYTPQKIQEMGKA